MKENELQNLTETRCWYALYVNSRAEKKVAETLNSKGIEAYCPVVRTMKQWSDRKKMVELPLLNGYVFIRTLLTENEKAVQTRGVVNFVRSEGRLAVIRNEEIERLKQLVELGYHLEAGAINKNFKEGERVRIASGALKNIEGFVLESKQGKYIEVLLESIGQSIRVKLPEEIVFSTN
jgi:transcription antitermination factor NusG